MKKTKVILTLVCAILLVAASVMGTLAYLTATTGTVTNTFTVGKVAFDAAALDEAKVNADGEKVDTNGDVYTGAEGQTLAARVTANTYKLVPGHAYTKDPTVHIASDSENAWLFVKVENGLSAIEATGTTTIASQMSTKGWVAVTGASNIYYWPTQVKANDDIVVFESFKLATDAAVAGYENATITIQAGIVQADGFNTAMDAWNANSTLFTPAGSDIDADA